MAAVVWSMPRQAWAARPVIMPMTGGRKA
jgi:hypothetical protein